MTEHSKAAKAAARAHLGMAELEPNGATGATIAYEFDRIAALYDDARRESAEEIARVWAANEKCEEYEARRDVEIADLRKSLAEQEALTENWRNDSREETERAERLQNELDRLRLGSGWPDVWPKRSPRAPGERGVAK